MYIVAPNIGGYHLYPDSESPIDDKIPGRHAEYKREVIDQQVRLMQERGIWKPPTSG
jgi:hypothetical protein